jgi:hypothetical protein
MSRISKSLEISPANDKFHSQEQISTQIKTHTTRKQFIRTFDILINVRFSEPVTVAERSSLSRKPGSWVRIPLRTCIFSVSVCAFFCVCVQVEALRRAVHPPKESYRLSKN